MRLNGYNNSLLTIIHDKYSTKIFDNYKVFVVRSNDVVEDGNYIKFLKSNVLSINGECWGQILNNSHLPSFNQKTYNNNIEINNDLQFLNARLDYLRKTITYWDTYQIHTVINDESEISSLNVLPPSTSAIINSDDSIQWRGKTYRRGDVIVNTSNQGLVKVDAIAAGAYVPKIEYDRINNNIKIQYEFVSSPSSNTTEESYNLNVEEYVYNSEFEVKNKSFTFSCIENSEEGVLFPIISFYIIEPSIEEPEEVKLDCTIRSSGSNWFVTINNSINLPNNLYCKVK